MGANAGIPPGITDAMGACGLAGGSAGFLAGGCNPEKEAEEPAEVSHIGNIGTTDAA